MKHRILMKGVFYRQAEPAVCGACLAGAIVFRRGRPHRRADRRSRRQVGRPLPQVWEEDSALNFSNDFRRLPALACVPPWHHRT